MQPSDPNWLSWVKAPIQIEDADAARWDDSADVVVIGFGGAGVCAALQARETGADVLAIDRFEGGGSTALSGGIIYAGGTRYQQDAGYLDTADAMFQYLKLEGSMLSDATLRKFCEGSAASLDWLSNYGLAFNGTLDPGKTTYPLPGTSLYFSGNERVSPYADAVAPAPRGHRAESRNGERFTGRAFFEILRDAALGAGVRLLDHAPARRLILDRTGRVIGVEVNEMTAANGDRERHDQLYRKFKPMIPFAQEKAERALQVVLAFEAEAGTARRIRARGGVILAAGGLVHNRAMMKHYAPRYLGTLPQGTLADDGSGIRLGQSVGGAVDRLGRMNVTKAIIPPRAFGQGIVVNTEGKRFVNEEIYSGTLGYAVSRQPGGRAWIIVDSDLHRRAVRESLPKKGGYPFLFFGLPILVSLLFGTKSASTIEGLARKCSIDPKGLSGSIAKYNDAIAKGTSDPFGKKPTDRHKIKGSRYYAVDISLKNPFSLAPTFSLGGLVVNESEGAVLRADGSVIKGLYAAGRNAIGLPSETYVSGLAIADCIFSGRRAGQAAAEQVLHREAQSLA